MVEDNPIIHTLIHFFETDHRLASRAVAFHKIALGIGGQTLIYGCKRKMALSVPRGIGGPMDIEFEWERDAKGYRPTDEEAQAPLLPSALFGPGGILAPENRFPVLPVDPNAVAAYFPSVRFPEGLPEPPPGLAPEDQRLRIMRNGGSLVRYRADQSADRVRIFEDFVNIKNAAGVLEFYGRWGPLDRIGNEQDGGEPVWYLARLISRMKQFIDAWADPDKATQTRFIERILGADGFGICDLEYVLVFDPQTRTPRRLLRIPNLFAALWMGMIDILMSDDAVLR